MESRRRQNLGCMAVFILLLSAVNGLKHVRTDHELCDTLERSGKMLDGSSNYSLSLSESTYYKNRFVHSELALACLHARACMS